MAPTYHVFYGTFIHLPAIPSAGNGKHVLSLNHGALWVSTLDGRIKGFEWDLKESDSEGLKRLLERRGWVVDGDDGQHGDDSKEKVKVRVFEAREEENEFFFPGFIGMYIFPSIHIMSKTDNL